MPRYPDSFIEEVRERVDLLGVVGRHVQLKKSGTNWQGLCPFHHEKTPSFNVRPDKGFFKCFGCGQGGDVFEFLMKIRGLSFNETVEELAAVAGLPLPVLAQDTDFTRQKMDYRTSLFNLLTQVQDYYHTLLMNGPDQKALNYLRQRGLTDQTIQQFRLGYAPPGWQTLADRFQGMDNAQQLLEEVGLRVNKGESRYPYDRFRDRVIFPIHDSKGRCVGFGGRTMDPDGKPKYINSPETVLYQKGSLLYGLHQAQEAVQKEGEIILVEGYMDLISLVSHGIVHCAATLGTALTDEQIRLVWQRSRRVVYCFDGDNAGRQAAWRALEKSIEGLEADRHVRFLFLPQGTDPDQFIRHHGKGKFLSLLEKAVGLIEFLTERLSMDLSLSQPEGKAALVQRIRPYLERVSDPLLKELFVQSLAGQLAIPPWRVIRGVRPGPLIGQWGERKVNKGVEKDPPGLGGRDVERTLLGLLLRSPGLISDHEERLAGLELQNQAYLGLLEILVAMSPQILAAGNCLEVDHLPGDEWQSLARRILADEEVVHAFPEAELSHCLETLQIKHVDMLGKHVMVESWHDEDSFEERYRKFFALRQERNRLMASHCSQEN